MELKWLNGIISLLLALSLGGAWVWQGYEYKAEKIKNETSLKGLLKTKQELDGRLAFYEEGILQNLVDQGVLNTDHSLFQPSKWPLKNHTYQINGKTIKGSFEVQNPFHLEAFLKSVLMGPPVFILKSLDVQKHGSGHRDLLVSYEMESVYTAS